MREKKGRERLFINIVASIVATIVGLGLAFLLTPYLVKAIGKETYAFYPIANNLVTYFTIIVTAFNALASRFITIEIARKNQDKAQEYCSSVLLTNIILALLFLMPMSIIVFYAESLFNISSSDVINIKWLFGLVFAGMLINIIGSIYGVATFVKERIDLRSYQQLAVSLIRGILYIMLFTFFKPNIIFIGVVTLFESIFNFVVNFWWTKKLIPDIKIKFSYANLRAVKELLFSGIWSSISSLGSNLLSGLTLVFSNIIFGAVASGTLSIAQTLPSLCTTILTMMINVFYPRLTNQYAVSGKKGLTSETYVSERIMSVIISVPIVLLIGMGYEFFLLWMPGENAKELQIASIIYLFPYVIQANMWTLTQVFPVMNKVKLPALVMVVLGITNVCLCYAIPKIATVSFFVIPLISTVLNLLYCLVFVPICVSKYLESSPWNYYKHIIRSTIATAATLLTTWMIKKCISCSTWIGFVLCGCVCALIGYAIFTLLILEKKDRNKMKCFLLNKKV